LPILQIVRPSPRAAEMHTIESATRKAKWRSVGAFRSNLARASVRVVPMVLPETLECSAETPARRSLERRFSYCEILRRQADGFEEGNLLVKEASSRPVEHDSAEFRTRFRSFDGPLPQSEDQVTRFGPAGVSGIDHDLGPAQGLGIDFARIRCRRTARIDARARTEIAAIEDRRPPVRIEPARRPALRCGRAADRALLSTSARRALKF
jgi:hypothetical protein